MSDPQKRKETREDHRIDRRKISEDSREEMRERITNIDDLNVRETIAKIYNVLTGEEISEDETDSQ